MKPNQIKSFLLKVTEEAGAWLFTAGFVFVIYKITLFLLIAEPES